MDATFSFKVTGLDCPACALGCQNAVRNLDCVDEAELNYATATLEVRKKDAAELGHCRRHVLQTVRECGEDVELDDDERVELEAERPWVVEHREQVLLGVSGIGIAAGLACESLLGATGAASALFLIAALAGLVYVLPLAVSSLRRRTCDMNVLMSIAVIGALAMGSLEEAALVIFLDQVGEWLEGWSMRRTRSSITRLMDLAPEVAHVVSAAGETSDVLVDGVEEGSIVRILPGERVPLDGIIRRGSSSFDEAPVTGEPVPQDKGKGQRVFGGTLNASSAVDVQTTCDADESTLARIVSMVQGAQAAKAPYEDFVDRFARVYTPVVVGIALVLAFVAPVVAGLVGGFETVVWRDWVYRALTMLVIACPCALVISTPVSFVSAITRAARMGVLVKGGAYFDIACKVDAITFDKTGTLTSGSPVVSDVCPVHGVLADDLLGLAAALEANSTHPLAHAVVERAGALGLALPEASDVTEVVGNGMSGVIEGQACLVGKVAFVSEHADVPNDVTDQVDRLTATGATALVVVRAAHVEGVIALADTLRPSTPEAIRRLRVDDGVATLVMLTGDNARAAEAIGHAAGVTDVAAELLPDGKVDSIHELQAGGHKVAHVGDGINDAPALAAADLGVTMGAAASDTALEVADIALLSGDLAQLPSFFELSRKTMNVVRENIAFALVVKVVVMVMAIMGAASMFMAVFADTGVALIVIVNGMRLMTGIGRRW